MRSETKDVKLTKHYRVNGIAISVTGLIAMRGDDVPNPKWILHYLKHERAVIKRRHAYYSLFENPVSNAM
jgi:hypothetical protein